MDAVCLLPQRVPTKQEVRCAIDNIRTAARELEEAIKKLGRLSAPIRYQPAAGRNTPAVTVQNTPWTKRHLMAMSAPGKWNKYTDLRSVLDRDQVAHACNEVLAGFDEISPSKITSNARRNSIAKALLKSTAAHFKEPIDEAIAVTVDVLSAGKDLTNNPSKDPSKDGNDMARQVRRFRTGK